MDSALELWLGWQRRLESLDDVTSTLVYVAWVALESQRTRAQHQHEQADPG